MALGNRRIATYSICLTPELRSAVSLPTAARSSWNGSLEVAGATNWYYCADETAVPFIASRLSPGSVVSFYFDDRITRGSDGSAIVPSRMVKKLIRPHGDSSSAALRAAVFGAQGRCLAALQLERV